MEHFEIYATAIATIGIIVLVSWRLHEKVGTVFKRFDQYKQHLETTHVSKEVFSIVHKQLVEDIVEIKSDVKKLLLMTKNGNGNK